MNMSFEQGPIRPPSESGSLLIRFTRNCPWNKCKFCPVYKGDKFSKRSLDEILADIDTISSIIEDIREKSRKRGYNGEFNNQLLQEIISEQGLGEHYKNVAVWLVRSKGHVFIQDANSLILKTEDLITALKTLRQKVPGITRITTYARSSTVSRKSLQDLQALKKAGLDRVHIGMESGSDNVLKLINKGITAQQHIDAGQKVVGSGLALSEYVMPGLGGREFSREHALETARVLNAIGPDYIRIRTLHVIPGTPLFEDMQNNNFQPLSEDETVQELRLFISSLEGIESTITSDHIMNLLEEVQGTLPRDKPRMLEIIDNYLQLPKQDRMLFQLGRKGGGLRSPGELKDPSVRSKIQSAAQSLEQQQGQDLEQILPELTRQYI